MYKIATLLLVSQIAMAQNTSTLPLKNFDQNEKPHSRSNDDFGTRSIGHLVTGNNNLLKAGEASIGTLYAGYGITENWTLGLSPFAFFSFQMANFISRVAWDLRKNHRSGFEFSYFKTFNDDPSQGFKMEAWDLKYTHTVRLLPKYRLSAGFSYFHYIDDTYPFSLRMDPQNSDNFAANFTTLHEFKLNSNFFVNLEAGFWGLNYRYKYYHLGATFGLQNELFLFSLGASATFSPDFPAEKVKAFSGYDSRGSVHPEVQVQAFF